MARPGQIRVEGARALRRDLKRAGHKVTGVGLKEAHQEAAEIVRDAARPPVRTGKLRSSLKAVGTVASATVKSTARVPWGNPIHWGWAARGIKPNPFLLDAMDSRRADIEDAYLKSVNKILSDIEGDNRR